MNINKTVLALSIVAFSPFSSAYYDNYTAVYVPVSELSKVEGTIAFGGHINAKACNVDVADISTNLDYSGINPSHYVTMGLDGNMSDEVDENSALEGEFFIGLSGCRLPAPPKIMIKSGLSKGYVELNLKGDSFNPYIKTSSESSNPIKVELSQGTEQIKDNEYQIKYENVKSGAIIPEDKLVAKIEYKAILPDVVEAGKYYGNFTYTVKYR